jgi:hypothetical protein
MRIGTDRCIQDAKWVGTAGLIARLNPEFISGVTPPNRNSYVRVPVGAGRTLQENATSRNGEGAGGERERAWPGSRVPAS